MSNNFDKDAIIKKSAELLRSGAKMLSSQCPACNSPLFQLKTGDIVCPLHGRVIIVDKEEEIVQVSVETALIRLEEKAMGRINILASQIDELKEKPSSDERLLIRTISDWLRVIYASRKIRYLKETIEKEKKLS